MNSAKGLGLSDIAEKAKLDVQRANYILRRLAAAGRIANYGRARGAKYWPAGTTAKEAL